MKKLIGITGLLLALLLTACSVQSPSASAGTGTEEKPGEIEIQPTVISADEAYERMQSGDPIVILDVRTAEEYAEAHIPGAIVFPNEEIGETPPAELPVSDAELLIYCRSGNRSAQAAKKLASMGYTKVYDFGGINSWPYDTQSGEYAVGEKAGTLSSFTAYDLNGKAVDERIFADSELTMINIWATFCGPCLREMPDLGELAAEYADKGVRIVGIVADVPMNKNGTFDAGMVATARELVEQTGAGYLHLLPGSDLISAKLKSVSSVPETIFVDSEGNLVGESYIGSRSKEQWTDIIDSLLEKVEK